MRSSEDASSPTAELFSRVTNDEEPAQSLINHNRYTFESLLKNNPEDMANAERISALTRDTLRKQRIASILLTPGIANFAVRNI